MPSNQVLTVDLTGLNLSKAQFDAIQSAVRSTTLAELAKLPGGGVKGGGLASGIKFTDPKIIGIWVNNLKQLDLERISGLQR